MAETNRTLAAGRRKAKEAQRRKDIAEGSSALGKAFQEKESKDAKDDKPAKDTTSAKAQVGGNHPSPDRPKSAPTREAQGTRQKRDRGAYTYLKKDRPKPATREPQGKVAPVKPTPATVNKRGPTMAGRGGNPAAAKPVSTSSNGPAVNTRLGKGAPAVTSNRLSPKGNGAVNTRLGNPTPRKAAAVAGSAVAANPPAGQAGAPTPTIGVPTTTPPSMAKPVAAIKPMPMPSLPGSSGITPPMPVSKPSAGSVTGGPTLGGSAPGQQAKLIQARSGPGRAPTGPTAAATKPTKSAVTQQDAAGSLTGEQFRLRQYSAMDRNK